MYFITHGEGIHRCLHNLFLFSLSVRFKFGPLLKLFFQTNPCVPGITWGHKNPCFPLCPAIMLQTLIKDKHLKPRISPKDLFDCSIDLVGVLVESNGSEGGNQIIVKRSCQSYLIRSQIIEPESMIEVYDLSI